MKYTLTILVATITLATFAAVALVGRASAQTNAGSASPGAAPPAHQGAQDSAANSADGVKQKVEDAVSKKLKSVGVKDLKSAETKTFGKLFGHHKHKKAVKKLPLAQHAAKDQASSG
jgi:hypothetical protein